MYCNFYEIIILVFNFISISCTIVACLLFVFCWGLALIKKISCQGRVLTGDLENSSKDYQDVKENDKTEIILGGSSSAYRNLLAFNFQLL